ncbi:MAG: hypothetical protein AB1441_04800 [Bacillota bacterium]
MALPALLPGVGRDWLRALPGLPELRGKGKNPHFPGQGRIKSPAMCETEVWYQGVALSNPSFVADWAVGGAVNKPFVHFLDSLYRLVKTGLQLSFKMTSS